MYQEQQKLQRLLNVFLSRWAVINYKIKSGLPDFLHLERLWRDVFTGCTYLYYNLFYYMETVGLLEPHNDIHLWCLHFVYQPRIDLHLQLFAQGWSRKRIRAAGNKIPTQLWLQGLYAIAHSDYFIAQEMNQDEWQVSFSLWKDVLSQGHPTSQTNLKVLIVLEICLKWCLCQLEEFDLLGILRWHSNCL